MTLEHVRVKIFAAESAHADLAAAIPVFHRWIQNRVTDEMLIDVADYRHMPQGPGVVLVAHEALYSLDQAGGRLGLMYTRRTPLEGDAQTHLRQAYGAALAAAERLEQEPEFTGKLRFNAHDCEIAVNDRLLAPNTAATYESLKPELAKFLDATLGPRTYSITHLSDPRELFRVKISA